MQLAIHSYAVIVLWDRFRIEFVCDGKFEGYERAGQPAM